MKAILTISALLSFLSIALASAPNHFDCAQFSSTLQDDDIALQAVKDALVAEMDFDPQCVEQTMANNLFKTNQYLFDYYFFKNGKYSDEEIMKYA